VLVLSTAMPLARPRQAHKVALRTLFPTSSGGSAVCERNLVGLDGLPMALQATADLFATSRSVTCVTSEHLRSP